jgi:hypothetical protein
MPLHKHLPSDSWTWGHQGLFMNVSAGLAESASLVSARCWSPMSEKVEVLHLYFRAQAFHRQFARLERWYGVDEIWTGFERMQGSFDSA